MWGPRGTKDIQGLSKGIIVNKASIYRKESHEENDVSTSKKGVPNLSREKGKVKDNDIYLIACWCFTQAQLTYKTGTSAVVGRNREEPEGKPWRSASR